MEAWLIGIATGVISGGIVGTTFHLLSGSGLRRIQRETESQIHVTAEFLQNLSAALLERDSRIVKLRIDRDEAGRLKGCNVAVELPPISATASAGDVWEANDVREEDRHRDADEA